MNKKNLILGSFVSMGAVEAFNDLLDKYEIMIDFILKKSRVLVPDQAVYDDNGHINISNEEKALIAFRDLFYIADEDGRTTRTYQGVILSPLELINAAKDVNESKDKFHNAIKKIKGDAAAIIDIREKINENYARRMKLNNIGLGRLNLNSCYRKIPILDECPDKIGFTFMSNGKSIKKITAKDAKELLEKLNENQPEHIRLQIEAVEKLNPKTVLAQIQRQSPIIKVNLVYIDKTSLPVQRKVKTKKPPLPILVPGEKMPIINFIEPDFHANKRLKRIDIKIEESEFLPSIRVHKYI
jgi:hypothetical protein